MLDEDLADLYGVEVKRLKEAVRRNKNRFPADFILELTWEEYHSLRTQIASLASWRLCGERKSQSHRVTKSQNHKEKMHHCTTSPLHHVTN
jgi:hypothetical protein